MSFHGPVQNFCPQSDSYGFHCGDPWPSQPLQGQEYIPSPLSLRGDCGAGKDEVNCSQSEEIVNLGIELQLLQASSRSQTTGYCLLLKPVDISRYLKSDFVSDLAMHTLIFKWYNAVQHQDRLLYVQAMVNLYYKSTLKCFLHRRLTFQKAGTYPLGMQIVSSGLKHPHVAKWSRRIQWKELSLSI